ncbi:MAG: polyprenyl synthetase family protein [Cyclobacteriaceae bacterium]
MIEAEIKKQKFGSQPKSLYEPIRYIMSLGGKRLRPLLTLISYSLYKDDAEKIISYAAAVEAFHNFTLLHDDIMDKAPLRRGKKTVHEKWNVNTAILSGDVMLVKVYEIFSQLDNGKLKPVLKKFNQCAAEVCEGQQWDMEFETKKKVAEQEYLEMIRQKTAVLLGFSLELGAMLADASENDCKALYDFGVNIGIGFQLKDDLLDVYADKKKFGKQVGGDILANKKTFLLIKALELAKGKRKKELEDWIGAKKFDKRKKIQAVTSIYNELNIKEISELKMNEYFQRGFSILSSLENKKANSLKEFANNLIERES